MDYVPKIESAEEVGAIPFGTEHTVRLFDNITSSGIVQYAFLVGVFENATNDTVYMVASEVNALADADDDDSHFLGIFDDSGHSNLGASNEWGNRDTFFTEAIRIITAAFGVSTDEESHSRMHENRGPHSRDPSEFGSEDTNQLEDEGKSADGPETEFPSSPDEALQHATNELESLIGLSNVKAEVKQLMNFLDIQEQRRRHGLRASHQSLHFVFTGNPGTGKTTVARILGKILYGFGILRTARMVECDRAKLIGGYLGQTAIKTDKLIQTALDGVLFIDEAYTLSVDPAKYGHGDMYGDEVIGTLLKRMEDYRGRLVVIAAGYSEPMATFIRSNPGLESRFTRFIHFEDYSVTDLCRIFWKCCCDAEYTLTPDACANAYFLFSAAYQQRDVRFGNARFVRNVYEQTIRMHSHRLACRSGAADKLDLISINSEDIPLQTVRGSDASPICVSETEWEAICPGCGKPSTGGVKYLGKRVVCKCGQKFAFPWWNPIVDSVPHNWMPYVTPTEPADKIGIVEQKASITVPANGLRKSKLERRSLLTPRENGVKAARRLLSDKRLSSFFERSLELNENTGVSAVEFLCQRLAEGASFDEIFYDGDEYGYSLSVEPQSNEEFRIIFGCQVAPTAGDGGEWMVTFDRTDQISTIRCIDCWMS